MTQLLGPAARHEFDDEARFPYASMVTLFGKVLTRRLTEQTNPHNTIGGHYFNRHHHPGRRNPAGSKLLRLFIRHGGSEQTAMRKRYADLTGRQYDHLNTPEAPRVEGMVPELAAPYGAEPQTP